MYTNPLLVELLEQQHQTRGQTDLFRKEIFILQWRAKVGSFPHPDGETLVSAGELYGTWKPNQGRPEDKRNVGENWQQLPQLPLNGYIPGSSIRGLVRAWAKKRPEIEPRMEQLLGYQTDDNIQAGKIEFFDAWPKEPTKLTLDIVNPQESFQVYHQGQGKPLSSYTLGDGDEEISLVVAIRGIPGRVTKEEVDEVWGWVQQALSLYGVGSRTASGYGSLVLENKFRASLDPSYAKKSLNFSLYSQGCYGVSGNRGDEELRPSHWRGWLRSWVLRFLLGVMSQENAQLTLGELFGTLEPETRKGCARLNMIPGKTWGQRSPGQPYFFTWKGNLEVSAPKEILEQIILPVIRIAASVGGVGRGWRRPLHIFTMNNDRLAARGSHLTLTHTVKNKQTQELEIKSYLLPANKSEAWLTTYQKWLEAVRSRWSNRVSVGINDRLVGEVFSPTTCAIYTVPAPQEDPINYKKLDWNFTKATDTRGDGMSLIYQEKEPRNYKRNPDLGGNAGRGNAHCSWVSIKRVNLPNRDEDTDCQETVCLFMGGQIPTENHVRSRFLKDLAQMRGITHLFGVQPPQST